jgi:hypothetical protein
MKKDEHSWRDALAGGGLEVRPMRSRALEVSLASRRRT